MSRARIFAPSFVAAITLRVDAGGGGGGRGGGWSRWRWQVERAAPPNGRYCIGRMTIAIGGQFDDNP
jgi:hypothetical protein